MQVPGWVSGHPEDAFWHSMAITIDHIHFLPPNLLHLQLNRVKIFQRSS